MAIIELPKDAQGREIPLDTECLYMKDGTKHSVDGFMFCRRDAEWSVETHIAIYDTEELYLTPPDSWEALEEDLDRVTSCGENSTPVCAYTRQPCAVCKFHSSENCTSAMCADIAFRIRKLRGEDR